MGLLEDIKDIVGDNGLVLPEEGSNDNPLVRPASTEEMSKVMSLCSRENQPVVPKGGLTGLVQGTKCQANEIGISLERMTQVETFDETAGIMTVQAGAILENIQARAKEAGWMYGVDLGARGSCTIGGNIATNAGGNSVVRYGMTRDQVLGLEVVLADGTVLSSMNELTKNNTGYDLKQLFIGAEGTLGIVTKAVLRLRPQSTSTQTAFVAVNDFTAVQTLLKTLRSDFDGKLSSFEVLWQNHYQFMTGNFDHQKFLPTDYPFYVLLETEGAHPEREEAQFVEVLGKLMEEELVVDAVIAQSEQQAQQLWEMRDDVLNIAIALNPMKSFDISLPLSAMEHYVEEVERELAQKQPDAKLLVFGHLGDGNIHLLTGPIHNKREAEEIVYSSLSKLGGSISAEHGIGLEKREFLSVSRNETELLIMRRIKEALDPQNLMNPHKLLG